jgi:hypothetical protein
MIRTAAAAGDHHETFFMPGIWSAVMSMNPMPPSTSGTATIT